MLESIYAQLGTLAVLLFLSGFFSGSETALFSISKFKLRRYEASGNKKELLIAKIMKQPSSLIVDIILGNILVNIAASSIGTAFAMKIFASHGYSTSYGVLAAIFVMTVLLLLFGEITPKTIAVGTPESFAKSTIRFLSAFSYLTLPIRKVLLLITDWTIHSLGKLLGYPSYVSMTEAEIKTIVEVSQKEGVLDKREKEMIDSVLDFTDTRVKEIMTPRVDIKAINQSWNQNKVLKYLKTTHASKLPVYEDSVDKIIGVIYVKDVLLNKEKDFKTFIRPIVFVPETKKIYYLLNEFKAKRMKIAIVIDEYGGTYGLITLEDILEEIFGEIHDEFELEEHLIDNIEKGIYRIKGKTDIDDVNKKLNLNLSTKESDTINGLILETLGRIPVEGELVYLNRSGFRIEKMAKRRVLSVIYDKKVRRKPKKKKAHKRVLFYR